VSTAPFPVIAALIVESWSIETCDPTDAAMWSPTNAARGQCVATAFLLHDLFGGDLLEATVTGADGSAQGFHYWNRLPDHGEVDLTLHQFQDDEVIGEPIVFSRPDGPPSHGVSQYRTLAARLTQRLGEQGAHVDVLSVVAT
jgi:hypothetical protein